MKVSIITVCYNSESTVESTIQSVLSQDYKDIEYIVVDGKSTDKTLSIIEKYLTPPNTVTESVILRTSPSFRGEGRQYKHKISKFVSEKDEGMYFALNKGIKLATGDIIGLLHADDFYSHEKIISEIVKEFESKKIDSIYGDLQYVSKDNPEKIFRQWKSQSYNSKLFLKGWMPPHPTFFVKRNCYSTFGMFNTSFTISADYELMLRFLYKHKISSAYIPEVLVKMRTGGISNVTLKSRIKANREDKLAWKINRLKPASLTFILKPLSKLRQFLPL